MSTTFSSAAADAALSVARATLAEIVPATATKHAHIVLTLTGSSYALHLRTTPAAADSLAARLGKKVSGIITVQARRVDVAGTGGRFIEPLVGRPRRVQGTVLARDTAANTLTLNAAGAAAVDGPSLPILLKLTDARQRADQFAVGVMVGCDVLDGGTFDPR
ncbi:MAG: hypothetical protein ACKVS8_05495 [Phycisphaerales bacterium]